MEIENKLRDEKDEIMILQTESLFPLRGILAEITLGLEFVIVFACFQSFTLLLYKFIRAKDKIRESRNLAWGILILAMGIVFVLFIIGDYFVETTLERDRANLYGYFILSVGAVMILIISEWVEKQRNRTLPLIGIGIMIVMLIAILFDNRTMALIISFVVALPLALFYIIYYTRNLLKLANYSREVITQIMRFLLSLAMVIFGYVGLSDFVFSIFGFIGRIIFDGVILLGLNLFNYSLVRVPIITEFDWVKKVRALIVLHEDGIPIFSRFYRTESVDASNETLVSGALSSLQSIIQAMMTKERLSSVRLMDKTLIFEYRANFICVMIADEYLQSIQSRLKDFADEFKSLYGKKLDKWDGNVDVFSTADWIADKYFVPIKK